VRADKRIEDEEDRPQGRNGGLELLAIVGDIEPECGRGDEMDGQLCERDPCEFANALQPGAHEMHGVFGGIE
jgi:hypothetical protein